MKDYSKFLACTALCEAGSSANPRGGLVGHHLRSSSVSASGREADLEDHIRHLTD